MPVTSCRRNIGDAGRDRGVAHQPDGTGQRRVITFAIGECGTP
jgi:hypothetical protein